MSGRLTVVALTLGLGALPVLAAAQDHAVPRGGGSSGSSSSGEHHSGGGSAQSSSGGSSSSGSSSSGSQDSSAPRSGAESRHPRAGTGTGYRYYGHDNYYYGSPYYYGSHYYSNAYDPFFYGYYGYSPFYYSGYYGYSPSYYSGHYSDAGSLRVIVDPNQARVYVDGYYAGIADDFDGIFQRLHVPPGRHEITLKLDGYRTHRFRVSVPPGETIKLHHIMERGSGEQTDEVVGDVRDDRYSDRERERAEEAERAPEDPRYEGRERPYGEDERDDAEAGTLRLDLRPADASVYVDGEFRGAGRRVESLRLAPGRHRLEIVRPGYRTVEREVDVRPGEASRIAIDLSR